jgi:ubiquinone/menaquinone biosynthesis C-methylase UbiE
MSERSNTPFVSPEYILTIGTGFMAAKTLLSAVELDLFSELARAPASCTELETRIGLHPRASRDFLDALVALGFLERLHGIYANTAPADRYLNRASEDSIVALLEMVNERLYHYWANLTDGLRSGAPQNELRKGGSLLFEVLTRDPLRHKRFLSAMTALSRGANVAIARQFDWSQHTSFVDVGTGQGDLAAQVALAHPHLTGIGFDLPQVRNIFDEHARSFGVAGRVRYATGDFFCDPIPKADVVMMGHILHDWDLREKKQLIRKAWDALPPNGVLIVHEAFIDDARNSNAQGLLMSLTMLIETHGGFDFTAADCSAWMHEAGFRNIHRKRLTSSEGMVVGTK